MFVTCLALSLAAKHGLTKEFLWQDSPLWSDISTPVGYCFSLAALLFFMRHMLTTQNVVPKSERVLEDELQRSMRYSTSFSLMMIDVDKFKSVNDSFGHLVGDQILIDLAQNLLKGIRETDILGRWGGEELLLICPETGIKGALVLAEKLRQNIGAHIFPAVGKLTSSFGVTVVRRSDTIVDMMYRADKALYRAKKMGRNRVEYDT